MDADFGDQDAINSSHHAQEEKAHDRANRHSGRRGGRGGGRGGRASGQGRDVQISRTLSKLLRHQAESAGIKLDSEGFAPLDKVVSCC